MGDGQAALGRWCCGRGGCVAQAGTLGPMLCAQQRPVLSGDSDWCWTALGGAGSCRRDWESRRICGLELPMALPGAGAPLGLREVTFPHTHQMR